MSEYKFSTKNETLYTSGDGEIFDKVTNPKHYKGNTLKYLLRERNKNGIEDLKKARKHLDWLIELEER